MKDIEFLNEVNDRVVLSVDEPIYQSTERFIHTMSEQLELSPQQIKDALDFQYLARRQRQLARPLIEAFVRSHPYAEGMPAVQYAQELLQAHPGINASMVEAYFQEASKAADVATVETPEAPAAEATTEEAAVTPETVSSEASPAGEVPASEPTDALEQAPVTEVKPEAVRTEETSASKTAEATQCRSAEVPAVKESWKKLAHALRISGKVYTHH